MEKKGKIRNNLQEDGLQSGNKRIVDKPTLSIDWDFYADYLENSNLSDEEKQEFLEVLWSIVMTFVDLGFGIEPVQQAMKEREQKLKQLERV